MQDMNNMKIRIIVTTKFVGFDKTDGFVFDMDPSAISPDSPLYNIGVKEFRLFKSLDSRIESVAVTINEVDKDIPYTSKEEWVKALIDTFCKDCNEKDEIYLLLHARTDLPPTEYGPYDASNWIDFNGLSVKIWAFSHERDSDLGVQPLLRSTYIGEPSIELFANKVKALFLIHNQINKLSKVWDIYYDTYDESILEEEIIPLLEEMNNIVGIRKINIQEFHEMDDDVRNEFMKTLFDDDINILKA